MADVQLAQNTWGLRVQNNPRACYNFQCGRGELSEWSIVRHSKCRVPKGTLGSNPRLSATICPKTLAIARVFGVFEVIFRRLFLMSGHFSRLAKKDKKFTGKSMLLPPR